MAVWDSGEYLQGMNFGRMSEAGRTEALREILGEWQENARSWRAHAQDLEQQVEELRSTLIEAQKIALAGKKVIEFCAEEIERVDPDNCWADKDNLLNYRRTLLGTPF